MIQSKLSGRIKVAVRQGGRVVKEYPWQDNLILDQGLDKLATMQFNQVFQACAAGTGSNPTGRDPQAIGVVSGTTLTSSVATFTTADLDSDCVFKTNPPQRFKIEQIVSPTVVTVFQSGNVPGTPFTIEYTNQAILAGETKRTTSYLATPGACGYLINPGNIVLWRTFLFTYETANITYSEIGLSDSNVAGPNLFSRIVLATPVQLQGPSAELPSGQQLQVTYQLTIAIDYGQGPGNYFDGRTDTTINVTNLPIQFTIWNYQLSPTLPNNLAVTVAGACPAVIGESIVIAGASVAGYNGTWEVLDSYQLTDPTHGLSTILSLGVPYTAAATGGTLTIPLTGSYYRACAGIYLIGTIGQSITPPNIADQFLGYGEPSVPGACWLSSLGGAQVPGSNNNPSRVDPSTVSSGPCVLQTYTPGKFYLDRLANIIVTTNENVMSFGYGAPDQTNQIETWVWDQPHAMLQGGTLALMIRMSWGRS